jgi:RND family efflux transporter MFP subunit
MNFGRKLTLAVFVAGVGAVGWLVYAKLQHQGGAPDRRETGLSAMPVEVAEVEVGPIELRRVFNGSVEANAEFVVAPKVSGRVEEIGLDFSDPVTRGQVVARLDNAEYVQAVTQAEADLAVAEANLAEARSLLAIAERELERIDTLSRRGVSSAAERDTAEASQLARAAHVEVTRAQVVRARAALETARIRLGYSEVSADWRGGSDSRVVAERYVDEGETVAANAPLLRIVELDPIAASFFVTERDYGLLSPGQRVELRTDAYAGDVFIGEISRVSPVFRENARQAQVELTIDNPDLRLKPGMFVRASVLLERIDAARIVPERAVVRRDDSSGVFVVSGDGATVRWRAVETGIRDGERVALIGGEVERGDAVVVLGQQLLDDGSAVTVAGDNGQ